MVLNFNCMLNFCACYKYVKFKFSLVGQVFLFVIKPNFNSV